MSFNEKAPADAMCFRQLSRHPAYRWVILAAACLSMFINLGYLCGSLSIMAIIYQDMYSERLISSTIVPVQYGICTISAFPSYYIARRFGDRVVAMLGALLTCLGYVLTGYTTEPWQGVFTAGLLTGWGAGIATITSYRMIPLYFEGKQFLPFAIISGFNLLASVVIPRSVITMSETLEFNEMFLLLGIGFLILNIAIATTYEPKIEVENKTSQDIQSTEEIFKVDIRIPRQDSATFKLPLIDSANQENDGGKSEKSTSAENSEDERVNELTQKPKSRPPLIKRQSSAQFIFSDVYPPKKQKLNDDDVDDNGSSSSSAEEESMVDTDEITMKIRTAIGTNIISMFSKSSLNSLQMKKFIQEPKVILHLVQVFFYDAGFVSFNSLSGDYARHVLHLTDGEIADALTFQAGAGIAGTLFYVVMAKYVKFSPVVLHTVFMFTASSLFLSVTFIKSYEAYLTINIVFGVVKALKFANFVNIVIEISPNSILAVNLQSIANILQGVGATSGPYIAGLMIQSINEYAGMYTAFGMTLVSGIVFTPVAFKYLWKPRQLESPVPYEESVQQIKTVGNSMSMRNHQIDTYE